MSIVEQADRLWRGEASIEEHHPMAPTGGIEQIVDGVAFVPSFANVSAFSTDDGLLLGDTGSPKGAFSWAASESLRQAEG